MLDYVWQQTQLYLENKKKADRKKIGQFFTPPETARFMAGMFEIPCKTELSILDPGAGTGILSVALIQRITQECPAVTTIRLTCFENNHDVLPLLDENLRYVQNLLPTGLLFYTIISDNYITSQKDDFNATLLSNENTPKFDLIIGNPPYKKVMSDSNEAKAMPVICYGAPNLYFLFAAMSLFNLKENGEMVFIMPRSWTSGAYFKAFRDYFLSHGKIHNIHLFISREKVFDKEQILQETMIVRVRKQKTEPISIKITTSESGNDYNNITVINAPYYAVVSSREKYVYMITSSKELNVLTRLSEYDDTLLSIGLRMKTGLTVDFRNQDVLRSQPGDHIIPMFYAQHIQQGKVVFPANRKYEYITDERTGLLQKNKNYVFVKRFTAKEEHRRLQCGIYLRNILPEYHLISTQNKINFIDCIDGSEMSPSVAYGLYVLLNSTIYDQYYRILNGSTQVNSTEINGMPIPRMQKIIEYGTKLIKAGSLTTEMCDKILEGAI